MSHAFPLAHSGREAVTAEGLRMARTQPEARRARAEGEPDPGRLVTDWVTLSAQEAEALQAAIARAVDAGFVQRYEDARGNTVLAVSYWSVAETGSSVLADTPRPMGEHTDDLYFQHGRTRKRRRAKPVDTDQFELFSGPDQMGYERRDPDNPRVIMTEEEGDGTHFGG